MLVRFVLPPWPWCYTRCLKKVVHMYLSDTKIRELIDRKVLLNADVSNIGQVTHDLRADGFFIGENMRARSGSAGKWCRSLGPESASSRTYEWENRQRLYADSYLRRSCYTTLDVRP